MFNQFEVPAYIAGNLPEMRTELALANASTSAYQSIRVLTDYTRRMALEHEFKTVEKCMSLVQKLYQKGNNIVRSAIENIFIYSFSTLMSHCNSVEWRIVQSYMPTELYSLYIQQVLKSKC